MDIRGIIFACVLAIILIGTPISWALKLRRFRKNLKVGDDVSYYSDARVKVPAQVMNISEDRKWVRVEVRAIGVTYMSLWLNIEDIFPG